MAFHRSHSQKAIEKIRQARLGKKHSLETRKKISESLLGTKKTPEHKESISKTLHLDTQEACLRRLQELQRCYPEPESVAFFRQNQDDLLLALEDVKSDKELEVIERFVESEDIERNAHKRGYAYSSSSFYAQENLVIECLDIKLVAERILRFFP